MTVPLVFLLFHFLLYRKVFNSFYLMLWNMSFGLLWSEKWHTQNDFLSIGKWIKGAKRYFLQEFIDSGNLVVNSYSSSTQFHPFTKEEALEIQKLLLPFVSTVELRGYEI